jgi:hypothetical protein
MQAFKQVLQADTTITVESQWRKIKQKYADDETCKTLSPIDRLAVFEEVIRAIESVATERERIAQQHQRTQQRRNREAFRVCCVVGGSVANQSWRRLIGIDVLEQAMLREYHQAHKFNLRTKWKEFLPQIVSAPSYQAVLAQPGYD